MNKQINIEVNGLEKPLVDVNKLNGLIQNVVVSFDKVADAAVKANQEIASSAKEAKKEVADMANEVSNNLGKKGFGGLEISAKKMADTLKGALKKVNIDAVNKVSDVIRGKADLEETALELADTATTALAAMGPWGVAAAGAIQVVKFAWIAYSDSAAEAAKINKLVTETSGEAAKAAYEEVNGLTMLETQLNDVNTSQLERSEILSDIQSKYKDYLGDLQLETLSLEEQAAVLSTIKERMVENQVQKIFQAKMNEQLNAQVEGQLALEEALAKKKANGVETTTRAERRALKQIEDAKKAYNALESQIDKVTESTKNALGVSGGWASVVGNLRLSASAIASKVMEEANERMRQQAVYQRQAEEAEKRRLDLIKKQVELLKMMGKLSQSRQNDEKDAIEAGDFEKAQQILNADKQAWELEKERIRNMRVANGITEQQVFNKQKELEAQKKLNDELKAAQDIAMVTSKMNVREAVKMNIRQGSIKTQLEASRFGDTPIPKEFQVAGTNLVEVFKLPGKTTEELKRIIAEAYKTADPESYLKAAGVITVFDAIDAQNKVARAAGKAQYNRLQNEYNKMVADYQKQESEGKRDIDAEDKEKQKGFRKRQQEIDKAREEFNKRVKAAEEEAKKQMASLGAILNDPSFKEQLEVLKIESNKEQIAAFENNVKAIEPLIKKVNALVAGTVTTDKNTRTINISTALADLLAQGKIAQEEYDQIVTITDLQNDLISRQKRAAEKREEDLKRDFVGQALDAFRKENADLIKNFELSLVELQLKASKLDNWYLPMIDNKLAERKFAEALKLRKTYTNEQLKIVEEQKRTELELAENLYVKELINLEAQGFDVTQMRQNFLLKGTEIEIKYEEQKKKLRKEYHEAEKALMTQQITEVANMTAQALDIVNQAGLNTFSAVLDYLDTLSNNVIENYQDQLTEVENALSESTSRLSSLEDDLEGKISGRRDAVLAAIELEKQREQNLAKEKIKLMNKIEAEERKIAKRRKALAITDAIINGARAITSIWATWAANPIMAGILTAASAAVTGLQIATISQQKFAEGGFTGNGTTRDETGYKVAGVVHEGEWVAPKWMVDNPSFKGVISSLEASRQRGYAVGGPVSTDVLDGINASLNPNSDIIRQMKVYTDAAIKLSNRPVIADVKEFSNVQSSMMRRMSTNSIG